MFQFSVSNVRLTSVEANSCKNLNHEQFNSCDILLIHTEINIYN